MCTPFNTRALKGLIPVIQKEPTFLQRWEGEYGEAAKISGPNQTRRHHPYTPPTTPEKNCSSEHATAGGRRRWSLRHYALAMNIESYESLTSRIGRLRLKRCGSVPALTVFVAYAPTSDYDDEEVEACYMELEKFYKKDHTFYKVIVGDFNAKIGPRRSPEELHIGTHCLEWNEHEAGMSICNAGQNFANFKTMMISLRRPDGTVTSSRRTMEKVIHDFYFDLFDSHVHSPHAIFRRMDTSFPLFSLPRSDTPSRGEEAYSTP
ncbi:unnamed protein product [Heligmosomoides polygyrus]|uniref:Endo/exonuclease/phosphatase domain-containing protein n=1 Tax=Heligmosomoides polygyrus TaxID=6339 RepID=A0A183GKY4_HELPZ|nr:unnamed protein product [Heligmosomoides polygyrus]